MHDAHVQEGEGTPTVELRLSSAMHDAHGTRIAERAGSRAAVFSPVGLGTYPSTTSKDTTRPHALLALLIGLVLTMSLPLLTNCLPDFGETLQFVTLHKYELATLAKPVLRIFYPEVSDSVDYPAKDTLANYDKLGGVTIDRNGVGTFKAKMFKDSKNPLVYAIEFTCIRAHLPIPLSQWIPYLIRAVQNGLLGSRYIAFQYIETLGLRPEIVGSDCFMFERAMISLLQLNEWSMKYNPDIHWNIENPEKQQLAIFAAYYHLKNSFLFKFKKSNVLALNVTVSAQTMPHTKLDSSRNIDVHGPYFGGRYQYYIIQNLQGLFSENEIKGEQRGYCLFVKYEAKSSITPHCFPSNVIKAGHFQEVVV
eukprot:GHVS01000526.1.p1 GENE.GHVS01000526.1~~GHVS01000526.1.p1  ORF type:complete len:372 (+),score=20.52 GHVS01000526.1:22-1116(+)